MSGSDSTPARLETLLKELIAKWRAEAAKLDYAIYPTTARALRRAANELEAVLTAGASSEARDMICEQHPELLWPHGDCAGPGCPLDAKDGSGFIAQKRCIDGYTDDEDCPECAKLNS